MNYMVLNQAFIGYIEADSEVIRTYTDYLLSPERADVPNGSSFAVTVDGNNAQWRLWLSQVSYNYLESLNLWETEHEDTEHGPRQT